MSQGVRTALIERLNESPTYVSLVGTRTYADFVTVTTKFPYVTITNSGGLTIHHQQGAAGLKMEAIQLDVWAANPVQRDKVFEAIRNVLDGWEGTRSGVAIQAVFLQPDSDIDERPVQGAATPIYRKLVPSETWAEIAKPTLT